MRRFWDNGLEESENLKLEEILKSIPTFDEFISFARGIPSQENIDDYERLYGEVIRKARDSVTE